MNEKHLELFTKVEDGLPEKYQEYQIIDIKGNVLYGLHKGDNIFDIWDSVMQIRYRVTATHFMDYSKLTTIEKAKEAMIDYTDSIRDYEHENNGSIYNDDRDSKEFVEIYLTEKPF